MSSPFPDLRTSITEVRMNPQDGTGYGRSMNWHYIAVNAANKKEEKCEHFDRENTDFDIDKVIIRMLPVDDGRGHKIQFKVSCASCDKDFKLTSTKLTKKFIKFYGL